MAPKRTSQIGNNYSARDVLEDIAKVIYNKEKQEANQYENQLKGTLSRARFADGLYIGTGEVRTGYSDSCNLNHKFNTNITTHISEGGRNPCFSRKQNRFGENAQWYCNSDKIRGNENKSKGTACAPPRRQHICDRNLEYLNNKHTDTTHDLLGNVLVTAKYEGEYIAHKHPNKGTSDVCTALARSFADLGDIIRGRDKFKPNAEDKVQKDLKEVFRKIHDKLQSNAKTYYNPDGSGNHFKLREDWWTVNRDQVWKALTCNAPKGANYVRTDSNGAIIFSSNGPCGRDETNIPTNLDYVPQYLRWFEEWGEEFCRKNKTILENVKNECRGEDDEKYCSVDGHSCVQTDLKNNIVFIDLHCPGCEGACRNYKEWIEKRQEEFDKQKYKYDTEIREKIVSSNKDYDKKFYEQLKQKGYYSIDKFLDMLNNGKKCEGNNDENNKIDFKNNHETFGTSEYCTACPVYGVTCGRGGCKANNKNKKNDIGGDPTDIDILINDSAASDTYNELKNCSEKYKLFKGLRKQEWKCRLLNKIDQCNISNFVKPIDIDQDIAFNVLFQRWLRYFVQDYNKLKAKIDICIKKENGKEDICIKGCKGNCVCVEEWLKKKEKEWEKIKTHYEKHSKTASESIAYRIKALFEQGTFPSDAEEAKKVVEKQADREKLWGCTGRNNNCSPDEEKKNDDFITNLITALKVKIKKCKNQHDEKTQRNCCDALPIHDEDENEPPIPQTPASCETLPPNPCAGGKTPTKTVMELASEWQTEAQSLLSSRGGSNLMADPKKGKYSNFRNGNTLRNVCNITNNHSNTERRKSREPCNGKYPKRLDIGEIWKMKDKQNQYHPEIYMPPRREHMCTSNLEHLNTNSEGLNDISLARHSLLGDVLLVAKSEAQNIKDKLGSDNEGICKAMKYSFADIGDIIKGTDLWVENRDFKNLQSKLVTIFNKIKQNIPKDTQTKYSGDNEHKLLRSDWWEANREKVWEAMKCKNSGTDPCSDSGIPVDDYIPQRLRWMTEWAEWFCKAQKKEYEELQTKCKECTNVVKDGKCSKDGECKKCKSACGKYTNFIKEWQKQWRTMEEKYKELYGKAQTSATTAPKGNTNPNDKDADVVKLLQRLQKPSGSSGTNTAYESASGYVHATAKMGCNKQQYFCQNPTIDGKTSNGDNEYVFKEKPDEYKSQCECKLPPKQPCEIVEGTLKSNYKNGRIHGCGPKEGVYPDWKCHNNNAKENEKGACVPPRRGKLCTSLLAQEGIFSKKEDIRTAFINSAAIETYFSWERYKKDNNGAEEELNKGKIPEGFKRQMYYTFSDYRDIFFRTDISSHNDILKVSQNVLTILKEENSKQGVPKKEDPKLLEDWWENNAKDIWEGMLCALCYEHTQKKIDTTVLQNIKSKYSYSGTSPSLDVFSSTPQFLRWFTEWGDEFCREQKTQLKLLEGNCSGCDVDNDGICNKKGSECTKCTEQCTKYNEFIKQWKDNYNKQKGKFDEDKKNKTYEDSPTKEDVQLAFSARDYLHKQLQNLFGNGKCNCMKETSKESKNVSANDDIPESLDKYPSDEYKNKCDCKDPQDAKPDSSLNCVNKTAFELYAKAKTDVQKFDNKLKVKSENEVFTTNKEDKGNNDPICKLKENNGQKNICDNNGNPFEKKEWECDKEQIKVGNEGICLPPRRKHMCLTQLENISTTSTKSSDALSKHVLLTAANEGKHLKEQWEKTEQNQKSTDGTTTRSSIKRYELCDAMKYSFADLGDIIRGRDILKSNNGKDKKVEEILKKVFGEIQKTNTFLQSKYSDDKPDYHKLRSAWWDANRVSIWKAMTCSAPNNFYFVKRGKGGGSDIEVLTSSEHTNCGHKHLPPNDDYIPQPFRWISEWTQAYCTAQDNKLSIFKDCDNCTKNNGKCQKKKYESCKKCKTECEEYNQFVENWKTQYDIQNKAYEEIYKNATTSNGSSVKGIHGNTKTFVENLKKICNDPKTCGEYLDKGNFCKKLKFSITSKGEDDYAFKEPANIYKENCECANKFEEVDQCPVNNDECNKYGTYGCQRKNYNNNEWNVLGLRDATGKNKGVLIPPRRKKLCLRNIDIGRYGYKVKDKLKKFKEDLLKSAATEAKSLSEIYSNDDDDLLIAMKYSFADIGNIVKGDDMVEDIRTRNVTDIFNKKVNINKNDTEKVNRVQWWEKNKEKVWNVMMCQYIGKGKTETECPSHEKIDDENQFLRWFTEWGENFCISRNKMYNDMVKKCQDATCDKSKGTVNISECTDACAEYKNYILKKKIEYDIQKQKYIDGFKSSQGNRKAQNFLKHKCYEYKCECLSKNFSDDTKWNDPYESIDDDTLKGKCDCKKHEEISIKTHIKKKKKPKPKKKKPEVEPPPPPVMPDASPEPSQPPTVPKPLPNDLSINTNISTSTIPLGIALALSSIAFLFLKRKTKLSPVDLVRVLNIPKEEYSISTSKSSNRYLPYKSGHYAGKTYIYIEGDESDNYIGDISSSDITSSESDVEEIDVNDIYPYRSPKHKTLIEVVLEPTKRHGNSGDKPKDDISTNKLTEEQWNQLKQEFISNTNQNDQMDIFRSNISGTPPTNTQHDPTYVSQNIYSGIDLINDSLSGNNIYDEVLKRKENKLFGTKHPKHNTTNSDPILNQLDLVDQWLDKNRYICETFSNKEELLDKLKELWDNQNNNNGITDISQNNMFNSNISLQTDMDPKPKNQFTHMDTILDDKSVDHNKIHIEVNANNKTNGSFEKQYPISDIWNI